MTKKFYCKAKEMYGEEWVKGYPTCDKDGNVTQLSYPSEKELGSYEYVLPETVGVYVGEASNGELFENDIFYDTDGGGFCRFELVANRLVCFDLNGNLSIYTPDFEKAVIVGNLFDMKVKDLLKWKESKLNGGNNDETN